MNPPLPILSPRLAAALVLALACPVAAPAAQDSAHILRLDDTPEDTVWRLQARVRHTTVITLPARETDPRLRRRRRRVLAPHRAAPTSPS